jgi:hypothetical protein
MSAIKTRSSDLPTKRVRASDGRVLQLKVVNADSETFAADFVAAFQSNVRRLRDTRRKAKNAADPAEA